MMTARPVALITAGAKRLGKAMALRLAQRGYDLALHCRASLSAAQATQAELESLGAEVEVLQADLSDEAQVASLWDQTLDRFGACQLLINNASLFERDEALTATKAS